MAENTEPRLDSLRGIVARINALADDIEDSRTCRRLWGIADDLAELIDGSADDE